jgi:hypothetical protein
MKPPTKNTNTLARAAFAVALAAVVPLAGTASASPLVGHAHRTVTGADGDTYHLNLVAGPTVLPAAGGTVHVAGTGYNRAQGIFLAFCVIPEDVKVGDPATYTSLPGPCLPGRVNKDGSSRWITDTGTGTDGITFPYKEGGSFVTTLDNIRPQIADGVTCGENDVRCAVVTRADFTATNDRTYDQYIPVDFAPAAP